jgi:hypothetical protein
VADYVHKLAVLFWKVAFSAPKFPQKWQTLYAKKFGQLKESPELCRRK